MPQVDFTRTLDLIRGGLADHQNTWKSYFENCPSWQETAVLLTIPLVVANVLLSQIFSRFSGGFVYGVSGHGFIAALLIGLILAALGVAIMSMVINLLAGVFGGQSDFSRAFAAVSLVMIPAWLAGIVGSLIPWVGFLVALAGGITSLVFLYKIIPLALGVPGEKRVLHYISSLVLIIVVQAILGMVLRTGQVSPQSMGGFPGSGSEKTSAGNRSGGFVGELERQGRLYESAQSAEFTPPDDGELEADQVIQFAKFVSKADALQQDYAQEMQDIADEVKQKEQSGETPSASDLGRMYSGMSSAMGVNNAEMEIVVTGGGNWAEHQWVKEQLRIARIQQGEGPDPIPHNYELYMEYQDEFPANYR